MRGVGWEMAQDEVGKVCMSDLVKNLDFILKVLGVTEQSLNL